MSVAIPRCVALAVLLSLSGLGFTSKASASFRVRSSSTAVSVLESECDSMAATEGLANERDALPPQPNLKFCLEMPINLGCTAPAQRSANSPTAPAGPGILTDLPIPFFPIATRLRLARERVTPFNACLRSIFEPPRTS